MPKQYITAIVFLLTILCVAKPRKLSGFYIDNGFDQTIAQRLAGNREKREVEYELLNILGLPERPKRIARSVLLVKRSAPKFLLNIYKNVLSPDKDKSINEKYDDSEEFNLSGQDINVIDESDVIMTFGAHNPHSGNATKQNRGKRIWFDVSEVPRVEEMLGAELRLYQNSVLEKGEPDETYAITIYRVARLKNGGRLKHYINSVNTTMSYSGWITLNVSQAVEHWIKYPKDNRGLFLAVQRANYRGHIMRPDDIGITNVLGVPDKQPFMVCFFKSSGVGDASLRRKRDIRKRKTEASTLNIRNHAYFDSIPRRKLKTCNIRTLYVSFKDLQWQDWIIAPEGYDAFYCSGECNFPLNTHMNATNHAIVQTLVHLIKPGTVPKPCCAPTKLSSISVLYFLDDSNVVLKKYKNMVVNSCGCH